MGSNKKYNLEDALNSFFLDCSEMLDEMENSLLQLEKNTNDEESINALFRAVHTIKGSSGMFGFDEIEKFTHIVENMLDDIRKGDINIDSDLIAIFLESHDYIDKLVKLFEKSKESSLDDDMIQTSVRLTRKLNSYLPGENENSSDNEKASTDSTELPELIKSTESIEKGVKDVEKQVLNECWHISIRFGEDVFRNALDPMPFINYLGDMGEIINIVTISDKNPTLEEMDPETCYLGLEIDFQSDDVDKEKIEDIFDFLIEDCKVRILPPRSSINDYVKLINELPDSPRLGEILMTIGSLTKSELDEALRLQGGLRKEGSKDNQKLLGEIVMEEEMVQKSVVSAAVEKQAQMGKNRRSIRIDPGKLDLLINLVGELVITGANVKQLSDNNGDLELIEAVSLMSRLIEDIRDSTMNVRMVQIGEVFKKFDRVVRDLSREKGKDIELIISGGDTELDKTLVEKINDPLMHLIRNAIDHGIGAPSERLKRGKPEHGTILLNAYHGTGSIIIEISDDGDGLNREKILKKSIERGLVQSNQDVPDSELFQLIFEPGFSTSETVTNISGRGVGMDVVKRNIQSLRGSISLDSRKGEGASVKIHLPLTLAIIDGFMVEVGDACYILPLDMVIECSKISREDIQGCDAHNFINLRGEVLPFLRLRDFFNVNVEEVKRENIVVVEYAQRKVGLVVDNLVGEFQTVIKPLGRLFKDLTWTIGATILGTGEVALILDVPGLVKYIGSLESIGNMTRETVDTGH